MSLYLGLDASTQSLSAMVIDTDAGVVVLDETVNFGVDLPRYDCPTGVLDHADPLVKHSNPRLWVAALDLLLSRCRDAGFDWRRVDGISGSGQQHGSVYLKQPLVPGGDWRRGQPLAEQLAPLLSRITAPIWMDSSTSAECAEIAAAAGGNAEVVRITGSRAIERFTGPQIRKFFKTEPQAYDATARIHLVSSFMASVLCGRDAGIDDGDGAGMNLLDLSTRTWSRRLLDATAPGLADRLPRPIASATIIGEVCGYFVETYGFRPGTPVMAFSGDNPNSLVGMGAAAPGTAVISLGTSDTYFAAMAEPCTDPRGYGHVFGNPAGGFMSLICFKNGSLAREQVKDRFSLSWEQFADGILTQTTPGNGGNTMLPYFVAEITPRILRPEIRLVGTPSFRAWQDAPAAARAVVEAQALSMRRHSDWIGRQPAQLLVTGGASRNPGIVQVLADVFGADIRRLTVTNSAALGAAMRAAAGVGGLPWEQLVTQFAAPDPDFSVAPRAEYATVYADAVAAFARQLHEAFGV